MTFADLMGLLMSFFVMLVAFSTQDKQKLQIVAGSIRAAERDGALAAWGLRSMEWRRKFAPRLAGVFQLVVPRPSVRSATERPRV